MSEDKYIGVVASAGALVLVVGPSGAGKDTLIAFARTALADDPHYVFVRRVVTRTGDAALEDHATMSAEEFADAVAQGAFPLHWQAHGLGYGVPSTAIDAVGDGRVVIANVSRGSIDAARALVGRLVVVHVTAPPAVLAERLAGRGREDAASILLRLQREAPKVTAPETVEFVNDGAVDVAGDKLVKLLRSLTDQSSSG